MLDFKGAGFTHNKELELSFHWQWNLLKSLISEGLLCITG